MAYIGVSPSNGVRQKHTYTATASQTTFSGAGSEGVSLSYRDSNYVDVYRNGVKLGDADYTATSGTSIVLGEGAAVNDIVEIVTYDVFSVADTVSKADGGTFDGNVAMAGTLAVTGETTLSANLNLGDNDKAIFGAGSGDLEIYSDGTYSRIMETGGLFLVVDTNGSQISLTADNSKNMGTFIRDGAVQLYFSNAQKFSTTSTGIDVTGTAVTDGLTVAGNVSVSGGTIKLDGNYPVGSGNVALGEGALTNTTSNNNNAIGQLALTDNVSGTLNCAFGVLTLGDNTTGSSNTAYGMNALRLNTTGNYNTAVGHVSGYSNTTSSNNTAVGYKSGYTNTAGDNTSVGFLSLEKSSSGNYNTALGSRALQENTSGSGNIGIGYQALDANTTGSNSVAIGYEALTRNTTAGGNVAVGFRALEDNTTGPEQVAVGYQALAANTTGGYSTAIGHQALTSQTTGNDNTSVGRASSYNLTTGSLNTAVGQNAFQVATTANYCVAIGAQALDSNTTASANVAVGYQALQANTTAPDNTAVGYQALNASTTGTENAMLGLRAGYSITTGSQNSFIGSGSGGLITTGSKNTIIGRYNGNQDGLDIRTSSNNIVLSDGDGNPRLHVNSVGDLEVRNGKIIAKNVTTGTTHQLWNTQANPYGLFIYFSTADPDNNANYFLNCQGNAGTGVDRCTIYSDGDVKNHDNSYGALSDIKLKEQIIDASSQWEDIKALTIRKYKMKDDVASKGDSDDLWRLGVVAQEVETAGMNGLVADDPDMIENENGEYVEAGTTTKRVKYSILYMKAVKALQEAMERIETLEAKVATLEGA